MIPAIKASNIWKEFPQPEGKGKIIALDNVSFDIQPGEIYGFLGANGAGKTTAIRVLIGLCIPERGTVQLAGKQPVENGSQVNIGYLPEEHFFYPHLKVIQFLTFMARITGLSDGPRIKAEVGRVTGLFDIAELYNQKIGNLSKGQRQKVALAQVFLGQPDIVFLDEPSTGLDPLGSHALSGILKNFKESGMTIFFSSHQLAEVELVSDRIGLIKKGKIILEGNSEDLLSSNKVSSLEELFLSVYDQDKTK